jgi:hypothetical protein
LIGVLVVTWAANDPSAGLLAVVELDPLWTLDA